MEITKIINNLEYLINKKTHLFPCHQMLIEDDDHQNDKEEKLFSVKSLILSMSSVVDRAWRPLKSERKNTILSIKQLTSFHVVRC